MNRFAYANGNPISGIDPFGTMQMDANSAAIAQAIISGSQGMGLTDYQALAAQLGLTGFASNLSENQQLYYGQTIADLLQRQSQGQDMSKQWAQVVNDEVPGVINDSNGLMASESANAARSSFLSSVNGYSALVAAGVIVPSAGQLAKILGTDNIHAAKAEILQDLNDPSVVGKNPDIGVDDAGNIVLVSRQTGKSLSTGVPIKGYGPGNGPE
jgi:hypothetical protein